MVVTCGYCAGDITWTAFGNPNPAGSEVAAVGECSECGAGWVARVWLATMGQTGLKSNRKQTTCRVCGAAMDAHFGDSGKRQGKIRSTCSKDCFRKLQAVAATR